MRKAACAALGVALAVGMAALASPAAAHPRDFGNVQRYGGHWRYQHRDWSDAYGYSSPGICWEWSQRHGEWVWTC